MQAQVAFVRAHRAQEYEGVGGQMHRGLGHDRGREQALESGTELAQEQVRTRAYWAPLAAVWTSREASLGADAARSSLRLVLERSR